MAKKSVSPKAAKKATKKKETSAAEPPKTEAEEDTKDTKTEAKKPNLRDRFTALPRKRKILIGSLSGLLLIIILLFVIPASRFAMLNAVSDADASVVVIDSETQQPVSSADVVLSSGESAKTDEMGVAFFNDINYGDTTATISKDAYESVTVNLTVSKDNIVFDPVSIVATGIPVEITAINWLTEEPITDFSVQDASGESVFQSVDGVAEVNVPPDATGELTYTVRAEGYNDTTTTFDVTNARTGQPVETEPVPMVISGRHFFISDRDGDIDFYSSDFDGSNVELLTESGIKGDYINYLVVPERENSYVYLRNSDSTDQDFRFDELVLVNLDQKSIEVVDETLDRDVYLSFDTVDQERVIYRVIFDYGDSRDNRYKVKSYEFDSGELITIYDGPTSPNIEYDPDSNVIVVRVTRVPVPGWPWNNQNFYNLYKVELPNPEKKTITRIPTNGLWVRQDEPGKYIIWLMRDNPSDPSNEPGYYLLSFASDEFPGEYIGKQWPEPTQPAEVPDSEKGLASPQGTNRVWIDQRDGKGRLILNESSNVVNSGNTKLNAFSVIRWIDENTITITGSDGTETADYIVDVNSGNYKKITNTYRQRYGGF